jgi:hypothetical protein
MSRFVPEATDAPQQMEILLDDLVSADEQHFWQL